MQFTMMAILLLWQAVLLIFHVDLRGDFHSALLLCCAWAEDAPRQCNGGTFVCAALLC